MARSTILAPGVVAAAVFGAALRPGAAGPAELTEPPIVGGAITVDCEWPSVVMLETDDLLCTGTLVSPRIVLYAAHCGVDFTRVVFGEGFAAGYFTPVTECKRVTEIDGVTPLDYAYCLLTRPISGVPIAPVLFGCEGDVLTPGREVAIAGFGEGDGAQPGVKRWAATTYRGIDERDGMLLVGGDGISASFGDSGGPAFVRLEDGSWRAFGIVSGGPGPGEPVSYVDMRDAVEWVENMSGHDITPCHAADGSWEPSYECGDFATDPMAGGSWDEQCSDIDPLSARSETCGEAGPVDDDAPVVAIRSPEGNATIDAAPSDVTIEIDASDATSQVRRVWLLVDGDVAGEDAAEPWSFTNRFEQGAYTIAAFAEDAGGNIGRTGDQELRVGEQGCLGCGAGGARGQLGSLLVAALAGMLLRPLTCRRRRAARS